MEKKMEIFEFKMRTKILFGINCVSKLAEKIQELQVKNILIVTDKGIIKVGLLDKVKNSLKSVDVEMSVFDEVESNPRAETVERGLELFRDRRCDAIIGVGGGSSIDTAKSIAIRAKNEGFILDYLLGKRKIEKPLPPVIAIPTTAGTGSEVSPGIVITDTKAKNKLYFEHEWIAPKFAIIDPLMAVGLPPKLTAWTGADALSHAVESYMVTTSNTMSEMFSLRALELINDNLREAVSNGENLKARSDMALAAMMALISAGNVGVTFNHLMVTSIGGYYDLHHGMLCGLMLPYMMKYSLDASIPKFANIARVMRCKIGGLSEKEAAEMAVVAIKKLCADVGIPQTLSELGVKKELFSQWSDFVSSNEFAISVTPPRASKKDIIKIYESAF